MVAFQPKDRLGCSKVPVTQREGAGQNLCGNGIGQCPNRLGDIYKGASLRNLLKQNRHSHPLIYMRGTKTEDIMAMVEFLYRGEAAVYKENLDSFLAFASELQLDLLDKVSQVDVVEKCNQGTRVADETKGETIQDEDIKTDSTSERANIIIPEKIPVIQGSSGRAYLEELDQKVKSMMKFSDKTLSGKGRLKICTVCGKEGDHTSITNHIEANHVSGLPIPCELCGSIARTRAALRVHKGAYHK